MSLFAYKSVNSLSHPQACRLLLQMKKRRMGRRGRRGKRKGKRKNRRRKKKKMMILQYWRFLWV